MPDFSILYIPKKRHSPLAANDFNIYKYSNWINNYIHLLVCEKGC